MKIYQNKVGKQEVERLKVESEKILNHDFCILSKNIKFQENIDWHTNFIGGSWPKVAFEEFVKKYYVFEPSKYPSDIKLVWELNKHLHLQDLAKQYLLDSNMKYPEEFISEINSWLDENPYRVGVNWIEGLIASHRVISWLIAWSVLKESEAISKDFSKRFEESFKNHSQFIEDTYEFAPRASNHLIGELCAQICVSSYFSRDDKYQKRLDDAIRLLDEELAKQVYPDGVHYEQSTNYQRVILEFLFIVLILDKRGLIRLPKRVWHTSEKMMEFMMHMTNPKGYLQPISDADSARVFILGNNINDFRPHLTLAAWIFNRKDFNFCGDKRIDEIIWFLSPKERKELSNIKSLQPKETGRAFPNGGYWISRDSWRKEAAWVFFDCGNIGMGKWPQNFPVGLHGHSDTLNFGLAIGDSIVTDLGSYSYTTEREFHNYFRSARGHNLPIIDGKDENIMSSSPWIIEPSANGENQEWKFTEDWDYFCGEHSGYLRLEDPVQLKREILFLKKQKTIILRDSIVSERRHFIDQRFHLYPGLGALDDKNKVEISNGRSKVDVYFSKGVKVEIIKSQSLSPEAWFAPQFGTKIGSEIINSSELLSPSGASYIVVTWGNETFEIRKLIDEISKKIVKQRLLVIKNEVTEDLVKTNINYLVSWFSFKKVVIDKLNVQIYDFNANENIFGFLIRVFPRINIFKKQFSKLSNLIKNIFQVFDMVKKGRRFLPDIIIVENSLTLLVAYQIYRKLTKKPKVIVYNPAGQVSKILRFLAKRTKANLEFGKIKIS